MYDNCETILHLDYFAIGYTLLAGGLLELLLNGPLVAMCSCLEMNLPM